jgi:hypothetical protein
LKKKKYTVSSRSGIVLDRIEKALKAGCLDFAAFEGQL